MVEAAKGEVSFDQWSYEQQHQIEYLGGQVRDLVAVVKATHSSPRMGKSGPSYIGKGNSGKGITSQNRGQHPQAGKRGKDTSKQYQCWQCGEVWHLKRECPSLKDKGLSQRGSAGAAHRD